MTNINRIIFKIHFYILSFVILNYVIQLTTNFGINSNVIFILKILIYISGSILFFLNRKPFKKISIYYFYYLLSILTGILFWSFGGIFLAILSSLFLKPIYPKDIKYQKENLKVYSSFNGFFAACCEYEITENKLFIFEKYYGKIKLDRQLEFEKSDIKIINNQVQYKHKVVNFNEETKIETDTIEKIKIE
ncbi:hypothetical protein [Flavobacterium sp.]|uniref:hypothetical protein n=1 Tax=Flavobacterium sp. TaxID=239 RepID=UPI0026131622|nr:hypothetical protein [Flavobacterium sp.]